MTHLMTIRAGVGVGSNAKWHAFTKMTSEHSVVNDLTEHAKIKIKEKSMSVRLRMTSVHAFASQSEEGDAFEIDLSGLNAQVTQLAARGLFHVKVMFVNTAEQRPQVNPFASMMAAKPATELPDAKEEGMYYHRISNVLLDRMRAKGLGYQKGDEAGEKAAEDGDDGRRRLDEVLERRGEADTREYRIRWKGGAEPKWEGVETLDDIKSHLAKFDAKARRQAEVRRDSPEPAAASEIRTSRGRPSPKFGPAIHVHTALSLRRPTSRSAPTARRRPSCCADGRPRSRRSSTRSRAASASCSSAARTSSACRRRSRRSTRSTRR